ncbi:MAG: serine/threonine-protein kinase, partial [Blastocatellia bacterium]
MPDLKLEHSLVDGRYEVYERLTRGSYAEIFVAYDRSVRRAPVVIKALNTSLQGTPDPDLERTLVENFQNEAVALDAVRHPHVILRLGHGTAADLRGVPFHYLVIEYMPGGDLLELCRHRPDKALPLDESLFYFHQVCEALAFAHSKGIIHRDLKPNNFLLSADKRMLKVADFGVAKITTGEASEITRVGADIYAPPEHNPNEDTGDLQQLTTAADVYSLAKSFYTVICGRAPSQFKCDPITSLPANLAGKPWGSALLKVLQKATDDNPKARYATVA